MATIHSASSRQQDGPAVPPRRGFLAKGLALALGAAAYAVPVLTGLVPFLGSAPRGPRGRKVRVAARETLPADGTPLKTAVVLDRTDAWTHYPPEPVPGGVFLRVLGQGDAAQAGEQLPILALSGRCPHAGACIDYDPAKKQFFCPAHRAAFDLDGRRLDAVSPSPRDMDRLEVELTNRDTEVWVDFRRYQAGTAEQIET